VSTAIQFDIHPDMDELLAAKQAVPKSQDPGVLRQGWNAYGARLQRPYPTGMKINDRHFACPGAGKNGMIPVRFYRPANAPTPSPCVVYLHGGAFIKGSLDSGDAVAWGIADQVGVVVVSVDYRLAADHPFPAGVEDCYAAINHLATRGAEYGLDPSRIGIWGDSAGANMTASVCLMARDRGGARIAAQALNYATLTDDLSAPSYRCYGEAPGVSAASIDRAWDLYLGANRPTQNPYAAPLKATNVANLPPAHIHYAEIDCLADDSIAYAKMLKDAGNTVVLRCAKRMIHGYLRARFFGPTAAAEYAAPCDFLKQWLRV